MDYGLIVDLETTGTDPNKDKIIEIGLLEFGLEEGREPAIIRMYGGLEDPGEPLSEEIKKLTGLDDVYLKSHTIDWRTVHDFFARASIVIAHNAVFDRAFLRNHQQGAHLPQVNWGCSMRFIDWRGHGFRTRSLNYLAADHGFVNPFAHRALFDCATTYRLITPYIPELIRRSYLRELRVIAAGAPYEVKDKLKARHYHWDSEERVWTKDVFEDVIEAEREFLKREIYTKNDLHKEDDISLNLSP